MAMRIGASCHKCGPVELTPADLTLMVETVCPDGSYLFEGFYSFYCPRCERVAAFELNAVTLELLVTAGVRVTAMPLELTEPHTGPANQLRRPARPAPGPRVGAGVTDAKPPSQPSGEGSETAENVTYHRAAEAALIARPIKDGIGWGDPFCVTPALPDRDCDIDDCDRDALWSVEAMGCDYDGAAPEVGPTAEACAEHVSTLMERWTW